MNVEMTKIGERGQVVIPLPIREKMKVQKGALFSVALLDEHTIVMKKIDREKLLADFSALRASIKKLPEADINARIKRWKKGHQSSA